MVPGTSNHWPYHRDLLVFCLKFRPAPVCEYLNYYYNITNDYWDIPEETQAVGFDDILFWKKTLKISGLSLYPWNFWAKQNFTLANSMKLCCTPCKFQGQKWRLMEIQHDIFFINHGNSTSFFLSWPLEFPHGIFSISMKFHVLYIIYIYIYIYIYILKKQHLKNNISETGCV